MRLTNRRRLLLSLLLVICLAALAAAAQHGYRVEKPVKFRSGAKSVRLGGRLPNTLETHDYVLRGVEGQRFSAGVFSQKIEKVDITFADAEYNAMENGGSVKSWSGRLPKTGVYHIIVASTSDRPVRYTLDISRHDE